MGTPSRRKIIPLSTSVFPLMCTSAEAEVVPGFCTGDDLMSKTAAIDTVNVYFGKLKHFCNAVIITAVLYIGDAYSEGNAVS